MIDFSKVKSIVIPEGVVTKIVAAGKTIWQAIRYKNWVQYSTEADGKTIYNGGLGYKNNYRLSSDGTEKTGTDGIITGFIPVKSGDIVRFASSGDIINWRISLATNCIHYYGSDKKSVGRFMGNGTVSGVCTAANSAVTEEVYRKRYSVTVPAESSILWVRVGVYCPNGPVNDDFIVTINEEIT